MPGQRSTSRDRGVFLVALTGGLPVHSEFSLNVLTYYSKDVSDLAIC